MALDLKLSLKLSQQLVMTPQLQQAIKLLQLNRLELSTLLKNELMENPILEEEVGFEEERLPDSPKPKEESDGSDKFDWEGYIQNYAPPSGGGGFSIKSQDEAPSFDNLIGKKTSLYEHLKWQLSLCSTSKEEEIVGSYIIGNINDDGYLNISTDEIATNINTSTQFVEKVLKKIQDFDPVGVGARDLVECLILQTRSMVDCEIARKIIQDHLKDLETKNYKNIQKCLQIPMAKVIQIIKRIAKLEPKPGRPFYDVDSVYITPDIYIYKVGDEYTIVLNEDGLPKLKVSSFYRNALKKASVNDKEYIHEKLRSAVWLIRSIHQRQRTIFKVAESIVKFQKSFFEEGISRLKPMVLRDIAEDIDMHESTVSRVTASKYIHTPQGTYNLKYFFNSGVKSTSGEDVASESIKDKIKQIVSSEDPTKPYSDQEIADILKESNNVEIARRTVAKYREMVGFLPSSKRKKII